MERSRFEHELQELGITGTSEIRIGRGEAGPKQVLLTHYHVRKFLSGGAALLSDTNADVMNPSRMKPGFNPARLEAERQILQANLTKLVSDKYNTAVSPSPHLKIALVDLTEHKSHTPVFVGHSEHDSMEGASLPKILALYAAYQLRFDLNTFAKVNKIAKVNTLKKAILREWSKARLASGLAPKLELLFQFQEKSGSTVEAELWWRTADYVRNSQSNRHPKRYLIVSPPDKQEIRPRQFLIVSPNTHRRQFKHYQIVSPLIDSNIFARYLIVALGFHYIGSVAMQSGLFDEKLGGLWLNGAYLKPKLSWARSSFPKAQRHNATAMAAASFFTLLEQGRLVNQTTSNEIAEDLKKKKCFYHGLLDGIKTLPGAPNMEPPNIPPNKCGLYSPYFHDAIFMIRHPLGGKRLQYVAVVLNKAPLTFSFEELGKDLDALIAAQNPP